MLVIRLAEIHDADEEGFRDLDFEVDGNRRTVRIKDDAAGAAVSGSKQRYADEENPLEVGAATPGCQAVDAGASTYLRAAKWAEAHFAARTLSRDGFTSAPALRGHRFFE